MTDLTTEQIRDAILRGLKEVGDWFAKNPEPTDGSVKAAFAITGGNPGRKRPKLPPG